MDEKVGNLSVFFVETMPHALIAELGDKEKKNRGGRKNRKKEWGSKKDHQKTQTTIASGKFRPIHTKKKREKKKVKTAGPINGKEGNQGKGPSGSGQADVWASSWFSEKVVWHTQTN